MVELDGAIDIAWQEMPKRYVSGKAYLRKHPQLVCTGH